MTFNIDFDGTCVTHAYPLVGKDIGAQAVLKRLVDAGHQLILFTMRGDDSVFSSKLSKIVFSDCIKLFNPMIPVILKTL